MCTSAVKAQSRLNVRSRHTLQRGDGAMLCGQMLMYFTDET